MKGGREGGKERGRESVVNMSEGKRELDVLCNFNYTGGQLTLWRAVIGSPTSVGCHRDHPLPGI